MSADEVITVKVNVSDPTNTKRVERIFVGTFKEIRAQLKSITTADIDKNLGMTDRHLKAIVNTLKASKKEIGDNGGAVINLVRQAKGYRGTMDAIGRVRVYDKLGKQVGMYNAELQKTAGYQVTVQRGMGNVVKTTGQFRREIKQVFNAQNQRLANDYRREIAKIGTQISQTGDSTGNAAKRMARLEDEMKKIEGLKIKDVIQDFKKLSEADMESTIKQLKELNAVQRGEFGGLLSPGKKPAMTGTSGMFNLDAMKAQLSGAFGFGFIEAGKEIQGLSSGKQLVGAFESSARRLGSAFTGIFGSAISGIASDVFAVFSNLGDIAVNALTAPFRLTGVIVGGFMRGMGFVIASGFLSAVTAGLVSGGSLAIPGLIGGLLFGAAFAVLGVVKEVLLELAALIQNMLKIIVNIITAVLKTIATIISAGLKIVFAVWKAAFKGIKEFTVVVFQTISTVVKEGTSALAKFIQSAFAQFVTFRHGVIKAAKEVADLGNKIDDLSRLSNKLSINFGFEAADVNAGMFDVVSSGFRSVTEATRISAEAAKLAAADQTSFASATNLLITVMQNYGSEIKDISKISRMLSAATTYGRTSAEELASSFRSVGGLAQFAKVRLDDLLAAISTLTIAFGRGSTHNVTRILGRFIEGIAIPTSNARKELESFGIAIDSIGGVGFGGKFIEVLKALKGKVNMDNLRLLAPTVQARRGLLTLINNIETFKRILDGIRKGNKLQGAQLALIFADLPARIKMVNQMLLTAKQRVGEFFGSIARGTVFSDRFMNIWLAIGNELTSPSLSRALQKYAELVLTIIRPLGNILLPALRNARNILMNISRTNPWHSTEIMRFVENLRDIAALTWKWIAGLFNAMSFVDLLTIAFSYVRASVETISDILKKIDAGELTFKALVDDAKELSKLFGESILAKFTLGMNDLAIGINEATSFIEGFEGKDVDIGALFDPGTVSGRIAGSLANVAIQFGHLMESVLRRAFSAAGVALNELLDGSSVWAKTIDTYLKAVLMIARVIESLMISMIKATSLAARLITAIRDKDLIELGKVTVDATNFLKPGLSAFSEIEDILLRGLVGGPVGMLVGTGEAAASSLEAILAILSAQPTLSGTLSDFIADPEGTMGTTDAERALRDANAKERIRQLEEEKKRLQEIADTAREAFKNKIVKPEPGKEDGRSTTVKGIAESIDKGAAINDTTRANIQEMATRLWHFNDQAKFINARADYEGRIIKYDQEDGLINEKEANKKKAVLKMAVDKEKMLLAQNNVNEFFSNRGNDSTKNTIIKARSFMTRIGLTDRNAQAKLLYQSLKNHGDVNDHDERVNIIRTAYNYKPYARKKPAGTTEVQGYAKGGYVNGPTLGLIGEGRDPREYIIPEKKMAGAAMNYLSGKRGASVLTGSSALAGIPRFADGGYVSSSNRFTVPPQSREYPDLNRFVVPRSPARSNRFVDTAPPSDRFHPPSDRFHPPPQSREYPDLNRFVVPRSPVRSPARSNRFVDTAPPSVRFHPPSDRFVPSEDPAPEAARRRMMERTRKERERAYNELYTPPTRGSYDQSIFNRSVLGKIPTVVEQFGDVGSQATARDQRISGYNSQFSQETAAQRQWRIEESNLSVTDPNFRKIREEIRAAQDKARLKQFEDIRKRSPLLEDTAAFNNASFNGTFVNRGGSVGAGGKFGGGAAFETGISSGRQGRIINPLMDKELPQTEQDKIASLLQLNNESSAAIASSVSTISTNTRKTADGIETLIRLQPKQVLSDNRTPRHGRSAEEETIYAGSASN